MTTIYIAGPMSGIPDYNRPAFTQAETSLTNIGYTVLNPARTRLDDNAQWLDYMRVALRLISQSDALALLPGWENSRGATIETRLASSLGLETHPLSHWLDPTIYQHKHSDGTTLLLQREGRYYRLIHIDKRAHPHCLGSFTSYTRARQAYFQQKNTL
jgi:phytoene dehydrogenase-like protein